MNPNADQKKIAADMARDPVRYGAEYFSTFRADVSGFLNRETVEACKTPVVTERAPIQGVEYHAFIDCASGQGTDAMTCAVAHVEGEDENQCIVIDAMRSVKPEFSPTAVCGQFAHLFKRYDIDKVYGDKWGLGWVSEGFDRHGIKVESEKVPSKSELYMSLFHAISSHRIKLLDDKHSINQICALERTITRGSVRENIDHPRNGHDDSANSIAGVAWRTLGDISILRQSRLGLWHQRRSPAPSLPENHLVRAGHCRRRTADRLLLELCAHRSAHPGCRSLPGPAAGQAVRA
jgi:hypothetical protein